MLGRIFVVLVLVAVIGVLSDAAGGPGPAEIAVGIVKFFVMLTNGVVDIVGSAFDNTLPS